MHANVNVIIDDDPEKCDPINGWKLAAQTTTVQGLQELRRFGSWNEIAKGSNPFSD